MLSFDFSTNHETRTISKESKKCAVDGKKDVELPLFSFSSVSAATCNFSAENKLGEGGFGPVYKVRVSKFSVVHLGLISKSKQNKRTTSTN